MNAPFLLVVNIVAGLFTFFIAGVLIGALFSKPFRYTVLRILTGRRDLKLAKTTSNPILEPGETSWNAEAVLNPAAISLDGKTHLVYRAVGMDGVSRLGYATSTNGFTVDENLPYPAFAAQKPGRVPRHEQRYSPVLYPSGGSWGGCEDPRMVAIDDRIYVTYNAFDGWDFIRVALISIPVKDFLAKRFFNWTPTRFISAPGQRQKNWVLFPEKIHGKFAILHSVNPEISIEYRDDIDAIGDTAPFVQSLEAHRGSMPSGSSGWDYIVRSAGPPPIKTDRGWLVLYHAHSKGEEHRYKLGAMLLDLDDPTKVLYRASAPVLTPDAWYENHSKPHIVYACGAVVKDGILFVYYGGSDKVVCVATTELNAFVDALIKGDTPEIEEVIVHSR